LTVLGRVPKKEKSFARPAREGKACSDQYQQNVEDFGGRERGKKGGEKRDILYSVAPGKGEGGRDFFQPPILLEKEATPVRISREVSKM